MAVGTVRFRSGSVMRIGENSDYGYYSGRRLIGTAWKIEGATTRRQWGWRFNLDPTALNETAETRRDAERYLSDRWHAHVEAEPTSNVAVYEHAKRLHIDAHHLRGGECDQPVEGLDVCPFDIIGKWLKVVGEYRGEGE